MSNPRPIPLTLFGIPFGLLGLSDCWLAAAKFGLVPVGVGRGLGALSVAGGVSAAVSSGQPKHPLLMSLITTRRNCGHIAQR